MLSQWPEGFQGAITIRNTGGTSLTNWTLGFSFSSKQTIANAWNTNASQKAAAVTMTSMSYNGVIAPGATLDGIGFIGVLSGTNPNPASFTLNGLRQGPESVVPDAFLCL
jgi:rhamnogalacturonan endolyase